MHLPSQKPTEVTAGQRDPLFVLPTPLFCFEGLSLIVGHPYLRGTEIPRSKQNPAIVPHGSVRLHISG